MLDTMAAPELLCHPDVGRYAAQVQQQEQEEQVQWGQDMGQVVQNPCEQLLDQHAYGEGIIEDQNDLHLQGCCLECRRADSAAAVQSINQSKRKTSNANGQTNLGHKHKAPDHNHEATQPMVDLPHTS